MIPTDMQGNQLRRSNWQELLAFYGGLLKGTKNHNPAVQNFNPSRPLDPNGGFCGWDAVPSERTEGTNSNIGSVQNISDEIAGWSGSHLAALLGINNSVYANETPDNSIPIRDGPTLPNSYSQANSRWTESSGRFLSSDQNHLGSNQMINNDSFHKPTDGFPVWPEHNVNSPPISDADAVSSVTTSLPFAPVTPEQGKWLDNHQLSEVLNFSIDESSNLENDKHEKLLTPIRNEAIKDHDSELLQNIVESSSATMPVPFKETNSEKQNNGGIDLNKTPQQKPPKRRKHRPKVVIEGKLKRTPRTKAPKSNTSSEKTSGKRKYVRKKNLKQVAVENEVTVSPSGSAAKSCGKVLNLDMQNETRDESNVGPKNNTSNEKPNGKRKYVRQKSLKDLAVQQADVTNGATVPPAGSATKSCRRVLNFNLENDTKNESHDRPDTTSERPSGKRKYVRKKGLKASATHQTDVMDKVTDPPTWSVAKSSRRVLNFDVDNEKPTSQPAEMHQECGNLNLNSCGPEVHGWINSLGGTQSPEQIEQQKRLVANNQKAINTCNFSYSTNQKPVQYMQLPEEYVPRRPPVMLKDHTLNVIARTVNMRNTNGWQNNGKNDDSQVHQHKVIDHILLQANTAANHNRKRQSLLHGTTLLQNDLATSNERRGFKRDCYHNTRHTQPSTATLMSSQMLWQDNFKAGEYNSDRSNFHTDSQCHKKSKTENNCYPTIYPTISSVLACIKAFKDRSQEVGTKVMATAHASSHASQMIDKPSNSYFERGTASKTLNNGVNKTSVNCHIHPMTAEDNFQKRTSSELYKEKMTQNISQQFTHGHDLNSLTAFSYSNMLPHTPSQKSPPFDHVEQIEACKSNMSAEKQMVESTPSKQAASKDTEHLQKHKTMQGYQQLSTKKGGPLGKQKQQVSVDEITCLLKCLDISSGSNKIAGQDQSALVPYKGDGTIVPFEGFDPIKKRKPRPKVDLDCETNRIWNLLMGKEGSESTEAAEKDKEKWWEEERRVFRGRVDSFIARMHLVQGDRRFSQWKGSVVDSIIGVFLTQNVSDHLSSSAFMALAAKFPLCPVNINQTCYGNGTSVPVEEPEIQTLEPDSTIKCHENMARQPLCSQSSIRCCETFGWKTDSVECPDTYILQGIEELRSSSGSNSEAEDQISGHKFNVNHNSPENLPQTEGTVMLKEIYGCIPGCQFPDARSIHGHQQSENTVYNWQNPTTDGSNNLKGSYKFACPVSSEIPHIQGSSVHPCNYWLKMISDPRVECFELAGAESISSLLSTAPEHSKAKVINSVSNMTPHIAESTSKSTAQENAIRMIDAASMLPCAVLNKHPKCQGDFEQKFQTESNQHVINSHQGETSKTSQVESTSFTEYTRPTGAPIKRQTSSGKQSSDDLNFMGENFNVEDTTAEGDKLRFIETKTIEANVKENHSSAKALNGEGTNNPNARKRKVEAEKNKSFEWDSLRRQAMSSGRRRERNKSTMDSLDYEALRCSDVNVISSAIKERGMNNMLAERIKDFLNRLVREHGSIDLEWLRYVPPDKAKDYLLSIRGLGLKSVECVRLLTLHHLAFPVDTNVGRIAVRLGWVPLQPLPESLQLHLLELYPVLESIQKYLWPRLCKLDQRTLYELHYQMITFGKVFCTKSKPNCNACPMRGECRHFASAFASARLALPGPEDKSIVGPTARIAANKFPAAIIKPMLLPAVADQNPAAIIRPMSLPAADKYLHKEEALINNKYEPIIEEPTTPEPSTDVSESDIEDVFYEDPDEIPTIKLNMEEFTLTLQNHMQKNNMGLQEADMSKALVALDPETASIPALKLKNVSRLRTEHQVYELPDSHPLLNGLDKREPDDPSPYLLAIWTPGETANSIQPPESTCGSRETGNLCNEKTCFSCNSIREANLQTVRGTLLIPCRTAMRGSFPLNGTYFQVNEMFADHESSLNPIDVPRSWIWNLPRRTVYFGTSVSTIFKGLSTEGIQYCFWKGFVCVRGFDQKTRAPRPLMARLHFPASKLVKRKNGDK